MYKIDMIVRLISIFDVCVYFVTLVFCLFMGIQRGKLIKIDMNPLMWISLSFYFVQALIMLWTMRFVVKRSYRLPTFTYYAVIRLVTSLLVYSLAFSSVIVQIVYETSILENTITFAVVFNLQIGFVFVTTYIYHIYRYTV